MKNKNSSNLPPINSRLRQLVDHFANGVVAEFAKNIDVTQQNLNRMFNIEGKTNKYPSVSTDIITGIVKGYPLASIPWLLTGEGRMLLSELETPAQDQGSIDWQKKYVEQVEKTSQLYATVEDLQKLSITLMEKMLVVQELSVHIGSQLGLKPESLDATLDTIAGVIHSVQENKDTVFDAYKLSRAVRKELAKKKS